MTDAMKCGLCRAEITTPLPEDHILGGQGYYYHPAVGCGEQAFWNPETRSIYTRGGMPPLPGTVIGKDGQPVEVIWR